uniref:Reverse transcriptase zinc-binding domain-containing protein n=1 Tax=Brassica campestris TaxID=3711 RepID=M4DVU8_BRACM
MGKYLGLPETFGRCKKDIFTGMVDKIRQRAHSWTTRFLSGAGKHVMLQSVLTALPTFSMTSFKIPISLCKRIQSILTRFWWDSSPDVHKIAWVAWNIMAQPKYLGGLGFKNFVDYNDSLLAKLGWRIMHNPDSLLTKVLKGKYFPDCSFLESSVKTGASHGWTSVMAGKAVLEKGLGYLVGNGENIKVWSDPWLSPSKPETPIGPPTLANQNLLVADLLHSQSNEWDLEKIRLHLPLYEEKIRLLIPSSRKQWDRQVWLPDPSGLYSAKSGYKKIAEEKLIVQQDQFDWKKMVWKLQVPPKIQHFLWRVLHNAIPVGSLLAIRGIQSALNCKRCGELESIQHLFSSCPFAVQFWSKVPLVTPTVDPASLIVFSDWYSAQVYRTALPPLGVVSSPLVPWLLWNLWTARNKLVFEGKAFHAEDIISKAVAEARVWEDAILGKKKEQKKGPQVTTEKGSHRSFTINDPPPPPPILRLCSRLLLFSVTEEAWKPTDK